jgi:hypothetical protein
MNQKSIFNWKLAVSIIAAFLIYTGTQMLCAHAVQWALEGTNEIQPYGSLQGYSDSERPDRIWQTVAF